MGQYKAIEEAVKTMPAQSMVARMQVRSRLKKKYLKFQFVSLLVEDELRTIRSHLRTDGYLNR